MKIILKENVSKIGRAGDIKNVSDGYARNFLIARGLATVATQDAVKLHKKMQNISEAISEKHKNVFSAAVSSLDGARIVMKAKANKQGHLFAAVHESDISETIKTQQKVEIPSSAITIKEAIKEIGEHAVVINDSGTKASLILEIKAA